MTETHLEVRLECTAKFTESERDHSNHLRSERGYSHDDILTRAADQLCDSHFGDSLPGSRYRIELIVTRIG